MGMESQTTAESVVPESTESDVHIVDLGRILVSIDGAPPTMDHDLLLQIQQQLGKLDWTQIDAANAADAVADDGSASSDALVELLLGRAR